jgi:hypothetical protein
MKPPQSHRSIDSRGTFLLQSICSELNFPALSIKCGVQEFQRLPPAYGDGYRKIDGLLSNDVTMVQVKGL